MEKAFFTAEEAAAYLGISKSYLYKYTHEKRIKFYKPSGRKIYFRKADLEAFILSGEVKTEQEIGIEAARLLAREA